MDGQCTLSNLEVHQYDTGRPYQGTSLFAVTIINRCTPLCDQSNVKLNCTGFKTVKPIDPSILNVSSDVCIVKNGQPITIDDPVNFRYIMLTMHVFSKQAIKEVQFCKLTTFYSMI